MGHAEREPECSGLYRLLQNEDGGKQPRVEGWKVNPLRARNDEIYRRWKAGENHVDLANEFNRFPSSLRTLIRNRYYAEQRPPGPPGPNNWEAHERNRPRDRKIIMGRAAGKTWQQLADEAGVCRERCRQIYNRHMRRMKRE